MITTIIIVVVIGHAEFMLGATMRNTMAARRPLSMLIDMATLCVCSVR